MQGGGKIGTRLTLAYLKYDTTYDASVHNVASLSYQWYSQANSLQAIQAHMRRNLTRNFLVRSIIFSLNFLQQK